jgi:predicted phosphodiesterase
MCSGASTAAKAGNTIMGTPPVSDEKLIEAWEAYVNCNRNKTQAAALLGLDRSTFRGRLIMAEHRGVHLPEGIREAMASVGINNSSIVSGGWLKTKEASIQFRLEKPSVNLEDAAAKIREALHDMPTPAFTHHPDHVMDDLLTLYPLPDIHAGMKYKRWGLAECIDRVDRAFDYLIDKAQPSRTGVIVALGDTLHHNDRTNKTQSGNVLDVDCTPEEAAGAMIASIARGIELALAKHEEVVVAILRGNHDRDAYLIVLYSLLERYRNEPRVQINKDDSEFFILPWEDVLFVAHHGDKAKPERLVMWIANEHREIWGRAKHCYLFTGHMHHMKMADVGGVQWEQLRAVTPRDDYATTNAYTGRAAATAITYRKGEGEVARITLNL